MRHILLDKTFIYDKNKEDYNFINNYIYDSNNGFWLNKNSGKPLIHEENGYKPRSKKNDIETGEDRKGE